MKLILALFLVCLTTAHLSAQKARPVNNTYTRSSGMTLSLPWANMYSYYDHETGRPTTRAGFVGLGLSYYYKNKKSKYSLNLGFTGDLPVPMGPVRFGKTGTRSSVAAFFAEGIYHHPIYKRLGYVAGVNFLNYGYRFMDYDNDSAYSKFNPTMGLTTGLEYVSKKSFSLALFYRPALVSFRTKQYWHQLSLDFRFDLPVWRK